MHSAQLPLTGYLVFLREHFRRSPALMGSVTLASVCAKILETAALVLPVKAVFVMLNPTMLPKALLTRGIGGEELLVILTAAAVVCFVLSRLLLALAHHLARKLMSGMDSDLAYARSRLTVRLSSSTLVLLLFFALILLLYYPAALLMAGLLALTLAFPAKVAESRIWQLALKCLGGWKDAAAKFRLLGSGLFLVFFVVLITMLLCSGLQAGISLILIVLIARRFFQEYARLRIAIAALENLLSGDTALAKQDEV